jgi:multidrug efflux system membrane fusion protein
VEKLVENGQKVKRGEVLLRIDPRDYAIRARRAESALNLARLRHARIKRLFEQKAATLSDFDSAEDELERAEADFDDARLALERCEVKSPIDGDVADIAPEIGEWLGAGGIIADIVDIDTIKIKVGIAERDLHTVRNLDACDLIADSVRGGYRFVGRKSNLSLVPADGTQVYVLELTADNSERLLRPGMFVEADVIRDLRDESFMAGAFTVMTTPSATYEVAVVADVTEEASGDGAALPLKRAGVARRVPVELGLMRDGRVEILLAGAGQPGLRPGDLLVVNGQRNLADGTPVRIRREVGDISEIDR